MGIDPDIKKQNSYVRQSGKASFISSANSKDIVGNYVIEKELGKGSWGTCFRAINTSTNDIVSLRMLALHFSKRELSSVQSAVRYTSSIDSDRFQLAIDESIEPPKAYVSSQFILGEDLFQLVRRTGPLPIRQSIYCIARAIEGLADIHKKAIVHGELRPSKIIVDRSGTISIRDLALAQVSRMRRQFAKDPTQIQKLPSQHLEYLAPEILSGLGKPNFSSDLYSLGCILFFLLTGKPPYVHKTALRIAKAHREAAIPRASRRVRGIPPSLDECLERMLAKQPADRFENYKQCHEALREIAQSLPKNDLSPKEQWEEIVDVDQSESADWRNTPRTAFQNRWVHFAVGLALLVVIGASIAFSFRGAANVTVEPNGNREIPTADSEDSFIIR